MKSPTSSISSRPRRLRDFLQQKYESIPKTKRHAMLAITCLLWFVVVGAVSGIASLEHGADRPAAGEANTDNTSSSPTTSSAAPTTSTGPISYRMALSIMSRQQGIMNTTTEPGAALQAGIVQKAFAALNAYHGSSQPEIQAYIDKSTAAAASLMTNEAADLTHWPLDRLSNGNAMLADTTNSPTVAAALDALRNTVHLNNMNDESGLWYWQNYPYWSYLDGMYSLGPFVAQDYTHGTAGDDAVITITSTPSHDATQALADKAMLQFDLLWMHCRNSTTGLLVHGYDANRAAPWASKVTGASGVVWARGLGWFMMAVVDTMELVWPTWHGGGEGAAVPAPQVPYFRRLRGMYVSLVMAVLRYADEEETASGEGGGVGWFQVVDGAGREGNYVESSATAMFAYALLKGARLGYLGPDDVPLAREAGVAAHKLLLGRFVTVNEDGLFDWAGSVGVCSLNSTATYDYYVSQPLVPNSVLGAAAFVLASVEVERLNDVSVGLQ
ncbi:glycosyl Hydrolase Family 88 [Diaporthe helianthi]|uniref:Glycosyl Hydrolase Family 88 n=1 Tax=Diaporthe helianthi TaxID=158607 RepID=A0A2P5IEU8_DIAHE|nr:glycosyl Hydrolase Family 88 [Diaporthe helianthi]